MLQRKKLRKLTLLCCLLIEVRLSDFARLLQLCVFQVVNKNKDRSFRAAAVL